MKSKGDRKIHKVMKEYKEGEKTPNPAMGTPGEKTQTGRSRIAGLT